MSKDEIINSINHYITTVAFRNNRLNKYYNYYNGKRDPLAYKYLTDNFGIQNAFDVPFIPVVHSHCKALIGQYLNEPNNNWTVNTSDNTSVSDAYQQKYKFILDKVKSSYLSYNQQNKDTYIDKVVGDIDFELSNSFQTNYQIAGNSLVKYYWNNLKLQSKYRKALEHLIISGRAHTREYIDEISKQPKIDIIDTRNIWYRKTQDTNDISSADSVIRRMFIDRQEILARWGDQMTKDDIEAIKSVPAFSPQTFLTSTYTRDIQNANKESMPYDYESDFYQSDIYYNYPGVHDYNKLEVYHVEFVSVEKIKIGGETRYRQILNEGYRIANTIFVGCGEAKYGERSIDDPFRVKLTYKSAILDDLGNPFSFLGRTADIQDNYDIIHYLLMNTLANSGVKVDTTILEHIPKHYGNTPEARILMNKAMKKLGEKIISISQPGSKDYNNYGQALDMSVDEKTMGAYINMLNYYEGLLSKITGVSPQVLAQIDQREAVHNVKTSLNQSATLNKPLFSLLDNLVSSSLTSLLNLTKFSIDKPKVLTYVHNNISEMFKVNPDEIWADFNVFVIPVNEEREKMEFIKNISIEAMKGQLVEIDTIIDAGITDSIAKAAQIIKFNAKKKKDDQTNQLAQQLEEANKKIEQLTKQLESVDENNLQLEKDRISLQAKQIDSTNSLKQQELSDKKEDNKTKNDLEKQRVQAEVLQLYDQNPNNDEVKNS